MTEADWEKFIKIKQKALDTYCRQVLDKVNELTADEAKTTHERYLQLSQYIHKADKGLTNIFDDHSRRNASTQLLLIRARDLADEALLAELSEPFLAESDPEFYRHFYASDSE